MTAMPKATLFIVFLIGMLFGKELFANTLIDLDNIKNNWHSTYKIDTSTKELKANFIELLMAVPSIRGENCKESIMSVPLLNTVPIEQRLNPKTIKMCEKWHINLNYLIGPLFLYNDVILILQNTTEEQEIIFHIANFGGYIHTGNVLLNEISQSKAYTVASVEGQSYSMAANIACSTNKLDLKKFSYLMFHTYRGGISGNGQEMRARSAAADKNFGIQLDQCAAKGVLTIEQRDSILNGTDIYVFPEDIRK
jgi:ATP-dependent protease ClpP protease subunit